MFLQPNFILAGPTTGPGPFWWPAHQDRPIRTAPKGSSRNKTGWLDLTLTSLPHSFSHSHPQLQLFLGESSGLGGGGQRHASLSLLGCRNLRSLLRSGGPERPHPAPGRSAAGSVGSRRILLPGGPGALLPTGALPVPLDSRRHLQPPTASRPLWVGSVPVAAGSALSPTTGGHGHDVAGDLPPCISPLRRLSPFIPFQLISRLNNYLMIDVVLNHVYITYLLVLFLGL